jgi:hypothetical protein
MIGNNDGKVIMMVVLKMMTVFFQQHEVVSSWLWSQGMVMVELMKYQLGP